MHAEAGYHDAVVGTRQGFDGGGVGGEDGGRALPDVGCVVYACWGRGRGCVGVDFRGLFGGEGWIGCEYGFIYLPVRFTMERSYFLLTWGRSTGRLGIPSYVSFYFLQYMGCYMGR